MATSPNFNWPEPDNTDLVKNGALAIRTAVNAIDTSLVDLKGGTTGQVLAKATNTDMDFSWVAQDDSNAIQNAIVDAKGDLIAASAADTPARLAVGGNYAVLSAQSGQSTGLQWAKTATSYTPSWRADGGSPSIGNGTLLGWWQRYGNLCEIRISMTIGSTTNKGTGAWYFGLPFTSPAGYGGTGAHYAEDAAVAGYRGLMALVNGSEFLFVTGTSGNVGATNPFTFNTGDFIEGQFVYEVNS
jgi:hypothetical protein